jgi:predicted metal-dependent enzyme (double-stranded beta helix superfamily)
MMDAALATLIEHVDPIVRRGLAVPEIVREIEPHLRKLVSQRSLDARYLQPILTKPYAQYLLYRPDDLAFSIVSFVWNSGQGSPVHDHGTWGVIAQYEGEEEETRFRRTDRGIEFTSVVVARPGEVSHVYPPDRDVHRILNRTSAPTISIHIYGGDIGSQLRHVYDLETGAVSDFVSGYDSIAF